MKPVLFLLVFLTACGGATVTEEWPDGYPQEIIEPEKQEYVAPNPEVITSQNFSIVKGQPVTFLVKDVEHSMELFEVTQERARMRVDDVSFTIGANETAIRSGVQLSVIELAQDVVPFPKKSVVDLSVGDVRELVKIGSFLGDVRVDFIGEDNESTYVRVVLEDKGEILVTGEEVLFGELLVQVNKIEYHNATDFSLSDGVTVSVK